MRSVYYYRLLYCSFCIYILCGMYFDVTMVYIVPYSDLTVFSVTHYPSYVRTTATTPTTYLPSSIMSTSILLFCFPKLLQLFLLIPLQFIHFTFYFHYCDFQRQMTTFQKEESKSGNVILKQLSNRK